MSESAKPDDPMYEAAVILAQIRKRVTVGTLQLQYRIGWNRAARLLEAMEKRGVVKVVPSRGGGFWEFIERDASGVKT